MTPIAHAIDHLVLTVRDPEAAAAFYARTLGLEIIRFGDNRLALQVGQQKINLQRLGQETRNHAAIGCGDLCLLTALTPEEIIAHLTHQGIPITEGPVQKTGAMGPFTSVYFNDPDGNLIELSRYP
ncbi:VOC family protein [Pseudooceanicola sp. C21-150M6]|uniref:VOC family protein n=1 Tax=Pseudooceanicola sp. C21-150M6 TaxID=3434355 RepID=UPI003D7FCCE7